jgi:hypothetical protein
MHRGSQVSSSFFEGENSRAILRVGLALIAALEMVVEVASNLGMMGDSLYAEASSILLPFLRPTPAVLVIINLIGLAGLLALALNRRPILGAVVALLCMSFDVRLGEVLFGSISHNFFFPGAMVFGWLIGLIVARRRRLRGEPAAQRPTYADSVAESCAVGVLAALYTGSAVTKVMDSGISWVNTNALRSVLLAQQGLLHVGWIDAYRAAVINHPWFSFALSLGALLIEACGFLLLVSRRTRLVWGLLIVGMHVNILFLAGIPYLEPMLLVPLFTLPWPALRRFLTVRRSSSLASEPTSLEG